MHGPRAVGHEFAGSAEKIRQGCGPAHKGSSELHATVVARFEAAEKVGNPTCRFVVKCCVFSSRLIILCYFLQILNPIIFW